MTADACFRLRYSSPWPGKRMARIPEFRIPGRCQTLYYSMPRKARIDVVADTSGIDRSTIQFVSKRTRQAEARKYLCFEAMNAGFPSRETGAYPGIGQAAVTSAVRQGRRIHEEKAIV